MSAKIHTSRKEKGQGLVEFAAALVILLILLAGVLDLGRAFFVFLSLRDAAQEGASYGSINPNDTTSIVNRVRGSSHDPVDLSSETDVIVQVTVLGNACAGNGVEVLVSYQSFNITTPFLGAIIGSQKIPIGAKVTDTILQPPCE